MATWLFSTLLSLPTASAPTWSDSEPALGLNAVSFTDCVIQGPAGNGQARGQCATLHVPENYDNPEGRTIGLRVFKLPSKHHTAQDDAVTFIQGGPGGSSVELAIILGLQNSALRRKRDIILLDQRGTGQSARLNCEFNDDQLLSFDSAQIQKLASQCVGQLQKNADLRQYSTSVAVKDLESLRTALKYSRWNIIAGSYGTRVAQHYMRRYPLSVRTATLEGVVPPSIEIVSSVPLNAQAALDNLFEQCASTPQCHSAYPKLKEHFNVARMHVRANPQTLELAHPTTAIKEPFELNDGAFNLAVRMMLYSPESKSLLPLLLQEAAKGNLEPIAAQAMLFSTQLSESMSTGMHNSVVCSEDMSKLSLSSAQQKAIEQTFLGIEFVDLMRSICASWPKGAIDDDFFDTLESEHQVLLISGEYDPVTPPSNAELAAKYYTNSLQVTAPGQGHSLYHPACSRGLINDFVASGVVAKLDTECFERLDGPPFFINSLGYAP
ncbi:MAG: alpha/beta hydrolase [Pseudomonadales bacterium]